MHASNVQILKKWNPKTYDNTQIQETYSLRGKLNLISAPEVTFLEYIFLNKWYEITI